MPEVRLIDARHLMRTIMDHEISMSVCMTQDEQCGMTRMRRMVIEDIASAQTVDAAPVRHGQTNGDRTRQMPELIDRDKLKTAICIACSNGVIEIEGCASDDCTLQRLIDDQPTIEPEVRHGRWIECDYKHMEHGMIETEPKAGLCCSECRTAFQKKKMTYKQYCAACGAKMDGKGTNVPSKDGGANNAE